MLKKMFATIAICGFAAGSAFAGTCTESFREMSTSKLDVNIKVKNDTEDPIRVSIWKGTETEKKTVFSDNVLVPSDGKEGKTDNGVTDATFYFSAQKTESDLEAMCKFTAYKVSERNAAFGTKDRTAAIVSFHCGSSDDFQISCEKGFNKDKGRWNVQYALESADSE